MLDETEDDEMIGLPATMSDIFFSLVAVVIVILLSLAPALRLPGSLATQKGDVLSTPIVVDGQPPALFVAEAGGVRIGQKGQLIPLDAILADAGLSQALAIVDAEILLVITEAGQEAAFLFSSLVGTAGVSTIRQLRLDSGCRYVADPSRVGCSVTGDAT